MYPQVCITIALYTRLKFLALSNNENYCWTKQFGNALEYPFSDSCPTKHSVRPNLSMKLFPQNSHSPKQHSCSHAPGVLRDPPYSPFRLPSLFSQFMKTSECFLLLPFIFTWSRGDVASKFPLLEIFQPLRQKKVGMDQTNVVVVSVPKSLFAVALGRMLWIPSPVTFIELGWSSSILAQQNKWSTLPSSQQLNWKTTVEHFWLWLRVCVCNSSQCYWFSLACIVKLSSKQQANSGREKKKVHSAALAGCKCTSQTVHDRSLNSIGERTERD